MCIHSLTLNKLKEVLSYDSTSGIFIWNINKKRAKKGNIAGSIEKTGYIRISIDGKRYSAHRLAWLYIYGNFPAKGYMIDHINHNTSDNRISNLRCVTNIENQRNASINKANTSGKIGVVWCKHYNKWRANIRIGNKKRKHLGYFIKYEDAVNARLEAQSLYGFHKNYEKGFK